MFYPGVNELRWSSYIIRQMILVVIPEQGLICHDVDGLKLVLLGVDDHAAAHMNQTLLLALPVLGSVSIEQTGCPVMYCQCTMHSRL